MTREEIKDELYRMLSDVVNGGYPKRNNTQRGRYRQAVKETIKVLEQEKADETTDYPEWLDYQDGQWIYAKCPVCESVRDTKTPFCPICGTKMKGVIGK